MVVVLCSVVCLYIVFWLLYVVVFFCMFAIGVYSDVDGNHVVWCVE